MFQIKQPPQIIMGENSSRDFTFSEHCLIITSKGAKKRNWLNHLAIKNYLLFDDVEPNPSIETTEKIIKNFQNQILIL